MTHERQYIDFLSFLGLKFKCELFWIVPDDHKLCARSIFATYLVSLMQLPYAQD